MPTFSITITDNQATALQWYRTRVNAARATQDPPQPALTMPALVEDLLTRAVASYGEQAREERRVRLAERFAVADEATRLRIEAELGV